MGSGQSRLGIKGLYATGAAPWALRERRAAGAAWGGGDAPGEAAWASAGGKGAFMPARAYPGEGRRTEEWGWPFGRPAH